MLLLFVYIEAFFILPFLVYFLIFAFLTKFYFATSNSIVRMEGVTREPIFRHMSSSLAGAVTIRALNKVQTQEEIFNRLQVNRISFEFIAFPSCTNV